MADETNNNSEEKAKNESGSADVAVKKKATKKRVAKKKAVTKKKTATTKKVVAKKKSSSKKSVNSQVSAVDSTVQDVPASKPAAEEKTTTTEAKPGTPTNVAAAAVLASKADEPESKAASSNVIIQTKLENKPPEEPPMSTDSKSSSGFWTKVTFWLIVIILGFMYIRSLAKNPDGEASVMATDTDQAEISTVSGHSSVAAEESVVSAKSGSPDKPGYDISFTAVGEEKSQAEVIQSETTETSDEAAQAEVESGFTSGSSITTKPMVINTIETTSESSRSQVPAEEASVAQDPHAESVTKILKEFDDLRQAAQAEREAMRNRMQAERDLHEAMSAPQPPAYRAQGYSPYGYGPGPGPYPQNYYR